MRLTPDNNRGVDSDLRQSPNNNRSYDAKIAKIRQYTEIILRRLLEYPCDKNIEIGNTRTTEKLDKKGYVEEFFRSSLEVIRKLGNERTHTKYRKLANEEEYREVEDSLLNIYAYLYYRFFLKYEFGSNSQIVSHFSLLPPIIREKTLEALFKKDSSTV